MKLTINDKGVRVLSLKKDKIKCDFCDSKEIKFYNEFCKKRICGKLKCLDEMSNLIPLNENESINTKIDKIIIEK